MQVLVECCAGRKIRALIHRQSQVDMGAVLTRINQIPARMGKTISGTR